MTTAAVVLTHNRPELLAECVAAIAPQVDLVLVVDNASDPPVAETRGIHVLHIDDQPPNLADLWNRALVVLGTGVLAPEPRFVAFLCDDTTPPDGWVTAVTKAMEETGAVIGCSNPFGHEHVPRIKTAPDSDIMGRMPGWAFILDTESGLRADESMRWWFCDTDLDFRARQAGGMVMVGGYPVPNHRPGEYTNTRPELGEQAGRDRATFAAKWGWAPW